MKIWRFHLCLIGLCLLALSGWNSTVSSTALFSTNPAGENYTATDIPHLFWSSKAKDSNHNINFDKMRVRNEENGWIADIRDVDNQLDFMNNHFKNMMPLHWAYNVINPKLQALHTNVWKYAVLYIHGGLYLEEQLHMETSWSEVNRIRT